jgi:DNA-binding NarL/FixJ family response regulator
MDSDKPYHELLSDREYQVLRLLGSGNRVSEIGEKLSISVKTVSTYRAHILEKMKLKNNAELTFYVMQNGLMDQ